ncbi:tetratricopeptide repeat protein [candidate division KSB1 bacterium]|nr:tetratricopeptide repeat protein [candidate division KSB1 bacterium]
MRKRFRKIQFLLYILLIILLFNGCKSIEFESALIYLHQASEVERAISYLLKALQKQPHDIEAYVILGKAYGMKENFVKMNAAFDSAMALIDTTIKSHKYFKEDIDYLHDEFWCFAFNRGIEHFENNRLADAGMDFGNCIIIDNQRADGYINLALIEEQINNLDSAIVHYEQAFLLDKKNIDLMFYVSNIHRKSRDFEKMIQVMDKVLQADPQQIDAITEKAFTYDHLGKTDEAIIAYQKALQIRPGEPDWQFNLARLYFFDGDYGNAIENFEKVLDKNPDDIETIVLLGDSYFSLGEDIKIELQEISLSDSIEITQEEIELYEKEAKEYFDAAIYYLEHAVELQADDPDVLNMLAIAYSNVGLNDKAEAIFNREEQLQRN